MDLHELRAKPINDVTFADIIAFCETRERESIILDYKQELSGKNAGKQVAKLAAAFSNTQGGLIIWGVEEEREGNLNLGVPIPNPGGFNLGADPCGTVRDACAQLVEPPINAEITNYLKNPKDPQNGFLLVRIPRGDLVPYTYDNIIYERVMDSSQPRPAGLDTIRHLLARRDRVIDAQSDRRARGIERLESFVDQKAPALFIAAGPRFPPHDCLDLESLGQTLVGVANKAGFRRLFFRSTAVHNVQDGVVLRGTGEYKSALGADVYANLVFWDSTFTNMLIFEWSELEKIPRPRVNRYTRGLSVGDMRARGHRYFADLMEKGVKSFQDCQCGIIPDLAQCIVSSVGFAYLLQSRARLDSPLNFSIEVRNACGLPFVMERGTDGQKIHHHPLDNHIVFERTLENFSTLEQFTDELVGDVFWALGMEFRPKTDELTQYDPNDKEAQKRAIEFYG